MRLIPTYSDEEFNQAQEKLIKEGYTWWNDNNELIDPIRTGNYPIFIIIKDKDLNLTWCPLSYVTTFYNKECRKIKLQRLAEQSI